MLTRYTAMVSVIILVRGGGFKAEFFSHFSRKRECLN